MCKLATKIPKPQDTGISVFLTFPQDWPTFFPEKSSFLINFLSAFASVQFFVQEQKNLETPEGDHWTLKSAETVQGQR